jgi:cleavage and polyadenylation specificity factor subunit 3
MLKEPNEIIGMKGNKIPRRLDVHYISFSAHVDYTQNAAFIDQIMPTHLVKPFQSFCVNHEYTL